MGPRGKSCHCPPQLGHRVIELPALLARGTPAFSPESELAIAAGYECPKSERESEAAFLGFCLEDSGLFAGA